MADNEPNVNEPTSSEAPSTSPVQTQASSVTEREPLPIWFFVGLILTVYGVLVIAGSVFGDEDTTILAEIRPGLWWGAFMTAFGAVFAWLGWRMHSKSNAGAK